MSHYKTISTRLTRLASVVASALYIVFALTATPALAQHAPSDLRINLSSSGSDPSRTDFNDSWAYFRNFNAYIVPPSGMMFDGTSNYTLRISVSENPNTHFFYRLYNNGTAGTRVNLTPRPTPNTVNNYTINPTANTAFARIEFGRIFTIPDSAPGNYTFEILNADNTTAVTASVLFVDNQPSTGISAINSTTAFGPGETLTFQVTANAATTVNNTVYLLYQGTGQQQTGSFLGTVPSGLNGTVFDASDFNAAQSVIIEAGDTNANVSIPVKSDLTTAHSFRVATRAGVVGSDPISAYGVRGYGFGREVDFTVAPPFAGTLTPAEANITEGGTGGSDSQEFTITFNSAPSTAGTLAITGSGDAASRRYTISPTSLDFSTSETTKTFTVTAVDDNIFDGDQNVTIKAEGDFGGSAFSETAVVQISDDETGPPEMSLSCPASAQLESTFTCTITRTGAELAQARVVTTSVMRGVIVGTVLFPAGSATTFDFQVTGTTLNDNEDVVVTIEGRPDNAYVLGTPTTAMVDQFRFGATLNTTPMINEGGSGVISLGISQAQSSDVMVAWQTRETPNDGPVLANRAVGGAGQDYTIAGGGGSLAGGNYSGTATIMAGNTNVNLTVTALQNAIYEGGQNRVFTLNTTTEVAGMGTFTAATNVTLVDDESAPVFSIAPASPTGGADRNVSITINNDNSQQSRFNTGLQFSATGVAVAFSRGGVAASDPSDFQIVYPALTTTSTPFNVQAQPAASIANITVTLDASTRTPPDYSVASGAGATASVEIFNVQLNVDVATLNEGSTAMVSVTATPAPAAGESITITYATRDGTLTIPGVAGEDYTAASGTATITATSPATFMLTALENTIFETSTLPQFTLQVNGTVLTADLVVDTLVEIQDNDGPPELALSAPANGGEGRNTTFTLTNENGVSARREIRPSLSVTGAAFVHDTNSGSIAGSVGTFRLTIPALSTADVPFKVQAESGASAANLSVTIQEDSNPPHWTIASGQGTATTAISAAAISVADMTVNEGGNAMVTITAVPKPNTNAEAIQVTINTSDGTAESGRGDYTAISGRTVTIGTSGTATFEVRAGENTIHEQGQNLKFNVEVAGSVLGTMLTDTAEITIADNEGTAGDDATFPILTHGTVPSFFFGGQNYTIPIMVTNNIRNRGETTVEISVRGTITRVFGPDGTEVSLTNVAGGFKDGAITLPAGEAATNYTIETGAGSGLTDIALAIKEAATSYAVGGSVANDLRNAQLVEFGITWASATHTINEGVTGGAPLVLMLDNTIDSPVSVSFDYQDGTASQSTHFTPVTQTGMFAANADMLEVNFTATDDMIDRADATFTLVATATATDAAGNPATAEATATITVADQDAQPVMTLAGPTGGVNDENTRSIVEGRNGTYTIGFANDIRFENDQLIHVQIGGGAAEIFDGTASNAAALGGVTSGGVTRDIPFAASANSKQFNVQASTTRFDDITAFVADGASAGFTSANYTSQTITDVTRTIRRLGLNLTVDDPTPDEGDTVTATVTLQSAQPVPVQVRVRTLAGTAVAGDEFTAVDTMLTIPAGMTTATTTIATMLDGIYRGGTRSFDVRATATIEGEAQADQLNVDITNADPLPVIEVTGPSGVRGGENATYTLTLPASQFSVGVPAKLRVRGNSVEAIYATDGAIVLGKFDPTGNSTDINHDIAAGVANAIFRVQAKNGTSNPDPIVVELLTNAAYTRSTTANSVSTTVTDLGIAFSETSVIQQEGTTGSVEIALNSPQTSAVNVLYRVEALTAEAGVEFTAATGTVTIGAGETTANIPVVTLDDNIRWGPLNSTDGLRNFQVVANATIQGTTTESSIQVNISENDPTIELEFAVPATTRPGNTIMGLIRSTNGIGFGDGPTINMRISGSIVQARAGTRIVNPMPAGNNTLALPANYPARVLEFPFEIDVIDGRGLENITIELTSTSGSFNFAVPMVEIEVREVGINFDAAVIDVDEPEGRSVVVPLNLTRIADPLDVRQVRIVTEDASALAGVHYEAVNRVIPYANGQDVLEVPITVFDNLVDESSNNPSPSFWVNATTTLETNEEFMARVRIRIANDNDESPTLAIISPPRIAPGQNGTVVIESNRTMPANDRQVMVQVNGSFDFAYNGTHTIASNPIVVTQGNNTATFGVTLAARTQSASFVVQASPRQAGVNLTPITIGFASGAIAGIAINNSTEAAQQNQPIAIRAGFDVKTITEAILPQIAVAVLDEVTSAISSRTHQAFGDATDGGWLPPFPRSGSGSGGSGLTIDGQSLTDYAVGFAQSEARREASENPWDDPTTRSLTELPSINSLAVTLPLQRGEHSGSVGIWAEGFTRSIDGTQNGVEFDGEIPGAVFGVDARLSRNLLAGIGFSQATGDFEYTTRAGDEVTRGSYEAELTGFHPYVGWRTETGGNVWASLGVGEGEVTIAQRGNADQYVGEVEFQNYGLGFTSLGDSRVDAGTSIALNIHGDINFASVEETPTARTRGNFAGASGSELSVGRTRIGATVSQDRSLAGGGTFRQSLDLALRHDSGDIAEGGAIELGGAVGLQAAGGLSLDLSARTLLSHEESIDDWGVKGGLRWTSEAFSGSVGRGLSLVLQPEWGNSASRGDALLDGGVAGIVPNAAGSVAETDDDADTRYHFDVRYGLALFKDGLLTPYVSGDAGDAESTLYGSAFSFGGFAAGVESASDEDNAFIRYEREF